MTQRLALTLTSALLFSACDQALAKGPKSSKKSPVASVQNGVKEAALPILKIASQAEQRLGVQTAFVKSQSIQRMRTLGGQTAITPDAEVTLLAPVAGRISVAAGQSLGEAHAGKPLYSLAPLLQAEQFINRPADEVQWSDSLTTAKATLIELGEQVKAAQVTLARVERMRQSKVGSLKMLQDAQAALAILEARQQTVESRIKVLKRGLDSQPVLYSKKPIEILAPLSGLVMKCFVRDRQIVSAAAPIATILDLRQLWVQVPVYVGDLESFDLKQAVSLRSSENSRESFPLKPIEGLPTANSLANTVTLFFKLSNKDRRFRPNQRVWVELPLKEEKTYRVVPYSSILYDMHGGSWVYQKRGANTYIRRRVEVLFKHGDLAVLGRGLRLGMEVVTVAAPELFGSEFWYR